MVKNVEINLNSCAHHTQLNRESQKKKETASYSSTFPIGRTFTGWAIAFYDEVVPVLVELYIPEDAKKKCEAHGLCITNKAITRWISDVYQWHGENMNYKEAYSFDKSLHYVLGEEVTSKYDGLDNGITFYLDMNVAKETI